ncbi:Serine/threonine-protein kinase Chk2-like protein [Cladobotryum mycophilum]|uniref:Serine/threonine-protein kinase Chk2-like protein n=1 Tax=Cladobotryum mycophilum TaxID=491253 RepID=A0ABR0SZF5_9HYPO
MTDEIARLYPADAFGNSLRAVTKYNKGQPAQQSSRSGSHRDRHEREHTELAEDGVDSDDRLPSVVLSFGQRPRNHRGFVMGCGEDCDFILPDLFGISRQHCAITFDKNHYLVVRDLGSLNGMTVLYDGENHGQRRNFTWIIGGHEITHRKTVVLQFNESLKFRIAVPRRDIASQAYIDQVDWFRHRTSDSHDIFASLRLQNRTQTFAALRQYDASTPRLSTAQVLLTRPIGEGTYGEVIHVWNASTGEQYALKKPCQQADELGVDVWRSEAQILAGLKHVCWHLPVNDISNSWQDNIVRIFGFDPSPCPQIWLEYAEYGSLNTLGHITQTECAHITHQCAGALAYLHDKNIVHRDVKPENILVYSRDASRIHVKLGDFGLSKQQWSGQPLRTLCGTPVYLAPEIMMANAKLEERHPGYGPAIDIWSLGVVVLQFATGLPASLKSNTNWTPGPGWCLAIFARISRVSKQRPNALNRLLRAMLVLEPQQRITARKCYEQCQAFLRIKDPVVALNPGAAILPSEFRESSITVSPKLSSTPKRVSPTRRSIRAGVERTASPTSVRRSRLPRPCNVAQKKQAGRFLDYNCLEVASHRQKQRLGQSCTRNDPMNLASGLPRKCASEWGKRPITLWPSQLR